MSRYCGPRVRLIRRLGPLPGLTTKRTQRKKTPGQHGKPLQTKKFRASLSDDFRERLIEKQKLRFVYGVTEKQMIKYISEAKRRKGSTEINLLQLLELRLDSILYRLGFAITRPAARQLINHGHILLNDKKVTIPSFECEINDFITIRNKESSKNLISTNLQYRRKQTKYRHLELLIINDVKIGRIISLPQRSDIDLKIDELKVVEYYSR
jgi:small subunit ribosomal protein S4